MIAENRNNNGLFPVIVGIASWLIPGAGYLMLNEKKRAAIVFCVIVTTFLVGLYIGSIAVIDPTTAKLPFYGGQLYNSPVVFLIANQTQAGGYYSYGKPCEIGQIYTGTSGLLNLLCIVNCVYLAHRKVTGQDED